jgi:hypothetical protein
MFSVQPWSSAAVHSGGSSPSYGGSTAGGYFPQSEPTLQMGPIVFAAVGLAPIGMVLNHQLAKGLTVLGLEIIYFGAIAALHLSTPLMLVAFGVIGLCGYIAGFADVFSIAQKYSKGEHVNPWDWF